METAKRATFSSNIGYMLSAAGAAIGLGNIWRFPYLTGSSGGALSGLTGGLGSILNCLFARFLPIFLGIRFVSIPPRPNSCFSNRVLLLLTLFSHHIFLLFL